MTRLKALLHAEKSTTALMTVRVDAILSMPYMIWRPHVLAHGSGAPVKKDDGVMALESTDRRGKIKEGDHDKLYKKEEPSSEC